jgi:ATP-dependent Clp protease ATP-binding subunit ClpX
VASSSSPYASKSDAFRQPVVPSMDPSRAELESLEGPNRDVTRVGVDGADPTLTHDVLSSRSREGQWGEQLFDPCQSI